MVYGVREPYLDEPILIGGKPIDKLNISVTRPSKEGGFSDRTFLISGPDAKLVHQALTDQYAAPSNFDTQTNSFTFRETPDHEAFRTVEELLAKFNRLSSLTQRASTASAAR